MNSQTKAENGEQYWGEALKIRTVPFAYVIFVWITCFSQPQAIAIGYSPQRSPQDSKPSANNSTCYSLAKSVTGCIKFTKRAELWRDFWHLDDVFEPPGQNELIVWKMDSRFLFSRLTGWRSSPTWGSDATLTLL